MGGAAGHMDHPFDLGWVKTGSNLVDFFERAKVYLEEKKPSSVKLDGVNVSFKVVDAPDGGKQFAVDRGTSAEVDISGITGDRVSEKFPEGHGMRIYIREMLQFLDQAIPAAESVLKKLGVWDDPTKFLNAEYAKEGVTNIIKYDRKFLAIHGINQFYEKIAKAGKNKGNVRTGLNRPLYTDLKTGKVKPIKDASTEIPYDRDALKELVEILKPYGEKYGFYIFGDIPSENVEEIDFSKALAEPFSIKLSEDNVVTKSLAQWLAEATNPGYEEVKRSDGRKVNPYHKELYKNILRQDVPLMDYIIERDPENSVDWDRAVDGAVMMHATRMLGNVVLKALDSELGNLENHEGVIFRDSEIFGTMKPIKITGDFILGGTESAFQQDASLTEEDEEIEVEIEDAPKTVVIVPGAFKPPHQGHADMVRKYASMAGVDEVLVLISKPLKNARRLPNGRDITAKNSKDIWELLVGDLPNVKIGIFNDPAIRSPISAAYAISGKPGERHAAAEKVDPPVESIPAGSEIILGASTKGGDWKRWTGAEKYIGDDLTLRDPSRTAIEPTMQMDGTPFSATVMRELLGEVEDDPEAWEKLEKFVGKGNVKSLLDILGIDAFMDIDEMSAAGAGGLQGAPATVGKRDDEDNVITRKLQTENNVTVDEIMRLIMEKGMLI